jgi:hypothetical protein
MMRLASVLLVLTLLTTSMISGTFAKYTTSGTSSDSARVAKWGVTVGSTGSLFEKQYLTTDEEAKKTITYSVSSNSSENVVAPGTSNSGDGFAFSITGKPEVLTKVEVTVSAQDIYLAAGTYKKVQEVTSTVTSDNFASLKSKLYTENSGVYTAVGNTDAYAQGTKYYELTTILQLTDAYYPVTFTNSNSNATATDGKVTGLATSIAKIFNANPTDKKDKSTACVSYEVSKNVAANDDLATTLNLGENKITWTWAYNTSDDVDKEDTLIGNLINSVDGVVIDDGKTVTALTKNGDNLLMAGETEVGSLQTALTINITVTQVD